MSCSVDGSNYRLSVSSISGRRVIPRDFRFHDYDRQISSEKGQTVARRTSGGIIFMHQEENTGKKLARLRGILVADTEWEAGVKVLSVDVPIQGRDKQ